MDRLAIYVLIGEFKMFHWRLDCPIPRGIPRENHAMIVAAILSHDFAIEVRFSHVISSIYINISESGNGNSQVGNPQAFCNFLQLMYFSCGSFDVKWAEEHIHVVKFNNLYMFFLSFAATSFVTCSPLFPRIVIIKSAVPALKDIRAAVARATWIPDQWLDRESVHSDVQRSKTHCEVGGLNCSGYTFWSTDRCDMNDIQPKKTSAFYRCMPRG